MGKQIEITIPSQITVGQYQKFGTLDHLTDGERMIRIVAAITEREENEVKLWELKSIIQIYKDLNERIGELQSTFLPVFEWEGTLWGFQPLHKMSGGEYIDLDNKLRKGISALNEIMAILYRPVTKHKLDSIEWKVKHNLKYAVGSSENLFKYYTIEEYDVEKREWNEERFKNLPISVALGAYGFFLYIGLNLSKDMIISSLPKKAKEERKKVMEVFNQLLGFMDGSIPSTNWQKMEEYSTSPEKKI
jgi:hypothetical protein